MHEDAAEETTDVPEGAGAAGDGSEAVDLADRVAEYDAELGAAVGNLEDRIAELEAELADAEEHADDLESKLKRKQADFQNYKKRAKKRQEEIKERATEDFLTRLVPVRDDLVRALDQDEGVDIRDGVESTLASFDQVLEEEGVTPIQPDAGDEVDPTRHQVMMRVESDQPEGTVVDVYRPGYEMAGSVIQEAQVTVSDGS
ncbi:nucleotide exchange factor GrpE [Haloplanus rubicundus]|uniref:Protein GrpE n=1 Tax=Haloplanus rubicundus TaxID=1547898 RepID=A0A345E585_9EURY|nr:nucleotide exchange factor GrpE [Haloplanus rubicundus]AXG07357.1 nucleotide exchange factor GrpE [Haloplanus rubicundus]AXG10773.1 nucleotide exchange factor GrpE [Haloplanus rubicundus]